jgi:hypothetical protein
VKRATRDLASSDSNALSWVTQIPHRIRLLDDKDKVMRDDKVLLATHESEFAYAHAFTPQHTKQLRIRLLFFMLR